MILWRLCEDLGNRIEGYCISDLEYSSLYYLEKILYEPITEEDKDQMIELKNKEYCDKHGLAGLWFWSQMEVDLFLQKTGMYATTS
jgi:hypothetical protein